jgi:hypothetical protein
MERKKEDNQTLNKEQLESRVMGDYLARFGENSSKSSYDSKQ